MNYLDDPAREPLIRQILRANTLPDVRAALVALRQWRQRYPDDWGIWDGGEQLSLMEDALLEDDSPPGQSPSWTEWQRLEYRVMDARTLPEIAEARRALNDWRENHLDEPLPSIFDTLFLLLDVVEEQQVGTVPMAARPRELAGQVA